MDATLPSYTPSPPSPSYSFALLPGEQTVEQSCKHRCSSQYNGCFRRITDSINLVLKAQRPGSIVPTYGRNDVVQGHISLPITENITAVYLKLEGCLNVKESGYSSKTVLVTNTYTMWQQDGSALCPKTIPFALIFPTTYQDEGREYFLPPTFEETDSPGSCSYTLTVSLSKPRQLLSFLSQNETLAIPLHYYPCSRPQYPILPSGSSFMSTVKSSPEEWHQIMHCMNTTASSGLVPIQCLLFIPSVQVYALTDTIPFHLQLRAPAASLSAFLEHISPPEFGSNDADRTKAAFRVYLSRTITAKVGDQKVHRKKILGEGNLWTLPLSSEVKAPFRHSATDGLETMDWEGEVKCSADVIIPGFHSPRLSVRDSIVLSISPLNPLKSPLLRLHYEHPVRLVTHPWSDQG